MLNYEFKRTSRTCSVTGRVFQRGESFVSALVENENGEPVRHDYSLEAWSQPPEGCIGWWQTSLPVLSGDHVYWAPRDVLLSYFQHVQQTGHQPDLLYVMSLLLVRKKIFKLVDTVHRDGVEVIHLKNSSDKTQYEITVVPLTAQRTAEIQQELSERLFTDNAATDLGDDAPNE